MSATLFLAAVGALVVWLLYSISRQLGALWTLLDDRLPPELPHVDEDDD